MFNRHRQWVLAIAAAALLAPPAMAKKTESLGEGVTFRTVWPAYQHSETFYCTFTSNPWTVSDGTGYHVEYFTLKKFYNLDVARSLRLHMSPLVVEE